VSLIIHDSPNLPGLYQIIGWMKSMFKYAFGRIRIKI